MWDYHVFGSDVHDFALLQWREEWNRTIDKCDMDIHSICTSTNVFQCVYANIHGCNIDINSHMLIMFGKNILYGLSVFITMVVACDTFE